ncbi:MAG: glycosyltransferase [Candidatus Micrarchaeota archaeon]
MVTIAVVVPTYNEKRKIERCVHALLRQSAPFDEIIFVDGGSTDGTREVIERHKRKYPYIRLLVETNGRGPGKAREMGWRAAKSDVIVFKDADTQVGRHYCETVKDEFPSDAEAVEFEITTFCPESASLLERIMFYKETDVPYYGEKVIRKSVFEKAGGYDTKLGFGEDRDFAERVNKVLANSKVVKAKAKLEVGIGAPSSLKDYGVKNLWYGRTLPNYVMKAGTKDTRAAITLGLALLMVLSLILLPFFPPLVLALIAVLLLRSLRGAWRVFRKSRVVESLFYVPLLEIARVLCIGVGVFQGVLLRAIGKYHTGR